MIAALAFGSVGCGVIDDATEALGAALGERTLDGPLPLRWRSADGQEGAMRLLLVQDGLDLTGLAVFEGHPCLTELGVSAKLALGGIEGQLHLDDAQLPFELKLFGKDGLLQGAVRSQDALRCLAAEGALQLRSL